MPTVVAARNRPFLFILLTLLAFVGTACGSGNSGFPKEPGEYQIQPNSLSYDGKSYSMLWQDAAGGLHKAEGQDVRMQRDERTFLQTGDGSPIVHLKEDEAVVVKGRDRDGNFESFWFPFFLGRALGGGAPVVINQPYPGDSSSRGPSYQYPPTDSFGRGDDLHGSVQRSKPQTPDYSKVPAAPYAVSGQGAGTGGGDAATNKSVAPATGQSGGTGAGSAASNKGTFSSTGKVSGGGTGVKGGASWGTSAPPSTGTGSVTRPSAPSRPKAPPIRLPSRGRR
jgi:hypothetical protein